MPRKKSENSRRTSVRVGNLKDVSGNVNIAGGNITTRHSVAGVSAAELERLFEQLYARIESRPSTPAAAKEDLKAEVQEIQATVTRAVESHEKIKDGFLSRRFRNIARMAPDLLDVIVATLANPLTGLGVAINKIAEKAKQETSQP